MAFPEYKFSMAVTEQESVTAWGNFPFLRAQDGEKLVCGEEVRESDEVENPPHHAP